MKNFKFCLFLLLIISITTSNCVENSHDQALKKAVIATYCGTLIAEAALLFPLFQSFIFGNRTVQEPISEAIATYAHNGSMPTPRIQEGYSFWHTLAGSIFSNHGTLFIDNSADIQNPEVIKALQKNLSIIHGQRDRNIFIAAFIIPALIYGILGVTSLVLSKVSPTDENLLGKIKKAFNAFTGSFTATSLITLLTIYSFIKAQDYYLNH
jgi:hypothetical protein